MIKTFFLLAIALLILAVVDPLLQSKAFSSSQITGRLNEIVGDDKRQIYVNSISQAYINSEQKRIQIDLLCKNIRTYPINCLDVSFIVTDSDGKEYSPLSLASIPAIRIPTLDVIRAELRFVIPAEASADTLVIIDKVSSNVMTIALTQTKDPKDNLPSGSWNITLRRGETLSSEEKQIKIHDFVQTDTYYNFDISVSNTGREAFKYDSKYAHIKDQANVVYDSTTSEKEPKLNSMTLNPQETVRGWVSFDVIDKVSTRNFMFIYDEPDEPLLNSGEFLDRIDPVLYLPENMTVRNNTRLGAIVYYNVTAFDDYSKSVRIECKPEPGAIFVLNKTTTVNCVATDESGNSTEGSFTITVVESLGNKVIVNFEHGGKTYTVVSVSEKVQVKNLLVNHANNSTIIELAPGDNGLVEMTLPKDLIDGIYGISILGQDVPFQKIYENETSTVIKFDVVKNAGLIEIYGARVIPEFSIVAALVLAVSFAISVFVKINWKQSSA